MPQLPTWSRDVMLLLARLAVGVVFIAHGLQKFLQYGIGGTAESFAGMGLPLPGVAAWTAALIETFGGLALLLGVAMPIAGVLLAGTMIGALVSAHLSQGFFASDGGFEYVMVLAAVALALGFNGGTYTLDRGLGKPREQPVTV